MNGSALSFGILSGLLATMAYGLLLAYGLRQSLGPKELAPAAARIRRLLLGVVLLNMVWAATEAQCALEGPAMGLGWRWVHELLDWARVVGAFGLLLALMGPWQELARQQRMLVFSAAAALLVELALLPAAVASPRMPGALNSLSGVALAVVGMVLVEQLFRNASSDARWHLTPLCVAFMLMFGYDLYLHAQTYMLMGADTTSVAMRAAVYAMAAPLLGLSMQRRVGRVGRITLSRQVVFYSGTLVLAGGYLLLMAGLGTWVGYFGGGWGRALQTLLVAAGLAAGGVVATSGSVRSRLKVWLSKHFFQYRYDYRQEWLKFTAMMSAQQAPQELGLQVVRSLADLVECSSGSLWLPSPGSNGRTCLSQRSRWNAPALAHEVPLDGPLIGFLERSGWVIDLQEARLDATEYEGLELPAWLAEQHDATLIIPLFNGTDFCGFVLLGQARSALELNWEVRDLLKTASRQAAGYLVLMQATADLLEARKFEAFNRMSAFVVHDLKNIVTQLSLMMKNADKHGHKPEFRADMLETVDSAVEKMKRLMTQLREGGAQEGDRPVDLLALLSRLQEHAAKRGRLVTLQPGSRLSTRGQLERLERVLGHLLDNALDATPAHGRVWLNLVRQQSQVCVEVGDTGSGMSEDFIRERLFKPFETTKATGMGIGMHESLQYVRELGGSIQVSSVVGAGTVMRVLLPALDAELGSRLPLSEAA